MRIIQLPNREFILEKTHAHRGNAFMFFTRANHRLGGYVSLGSSKVSIPTQLVGKKLIFKVEVVNEK